MRNKMPRPPNTTGTAWVIENTITTEFWTPGGWVKHRWEAMAFEMFEDAYAMMEEHGLEDILGVEPVEYRKEFLVVIRKKRKK